jgi:xanthine dehydrogenase accessory factor
MNVFAAAAEAWRTGRRAALATVIESGGSTPRQGGARMLVYADGGTVGTIGGGALEYEVCARAVRVATTGRPERYTAHLVADLGMCCGGRVELYIEPLHARTPFVMFGAGHVAAAVAPLLVSLDFDVQVIDARDDLCREERFPGCTVHTTDPRRYAAAMPDDPAACWLIVTHDHALDQDLVETLLPKSFAWLGMIGSRGKVARFLVRLRASGMDPGLFSRLSAPVGLDLGAETPAEIAVAIAAELVRLRRAPDRDAAPLSERALEVRGGDGKAKAPGWALRTGE